MAIPDEKQGTVKIVHFGDEKKVVEVPAHNGSVAAMKLSQDGSILVTASDKGTLLRMFNTTTGEKITEVRRGADHAVITDINLDASNKFLCCASDKGTIHVFSMNDDQQENKKSSLFAMGKVISYFGSTWSFS